MYFLRFVFPFCKSFNPEGMIFMTERALMHSHLILFLQSWRTCECVDTSIPPRKIIHLVRFYISDLIQHLVFTCWPVGNGCAFGSYFLLLESCIFSSNFESNSPLVNFNFVSNSSLNKDRTRDPGALIPWPHCVEDPIWLLFVVLSFSFSQLAF